MAKRNLCYHHHCQEFDKLPNAHRHLAADWRTVEPCELCTAERERLLAALEAVEWTFGGDAYYCPWCGNNKVYGHDAKCPRQAAIAGARGGEAEAGIPWAEYQPFVPEI